MHMRMILGLMAIALLSGCNGQRYHGEDITVPQGFTPTLDGTILEDEWSNARREAISDSTALLLMHGSDYLYLGIRAKTEDMIVGNIFVVRGENVAVLHSSAALGTAIYSEEGNVWRQSKGFEWCCRSTGEGASTKAERDSFLEEEHWLANNSRMGAPNELEYQLKIPDETSESQ